MIFLPQTESTNLALRALSNAENMENLSVVWTDFQTKGRGQAGNSWESELGMNLLCSILFFPTHLAANQSFVVAELTALCVKNTLGRYVSDISVKWPNDIYHQHKKISGILIENDITGSRITRSIIGIGINLNQTVFKSEAPNPVSLASIIGHTVERTEILNQLHADFKLFISLLEAKGINYLHQQYCDSLYHRNGFHAYKDKDGYFEARIHSIEPTGRLILERRNGLLSRYDFKEVETLTPT